MHTAFISSGIIWLAGVPIWVGHWLQYLSCKNDFIHKNQLTVKNTFIKMQLNKISIQRNKYRQWITYLINIVMKVKVLHINDKLLTVESLTQTKSFSLAISFSPIQCLVLGQSSFQYKKKVTNVMISYMFKASKLVHYSTNKHSLFLSELYIMSILTK